MKRTPERQQSQMFTSKHLFTTDPRNHHHQRFCTRPRCQKASKILNRKLWLAKPGNRKLGADRLRLSESAPGARPIHTIGNAHFPYSADVKLRYKDFIVAARALLPSWTNTFQFFGWEA
ncbi:MAG TPA: hypothetical protein VH413_13355 [Verrucomicrobiae bacterium]|jgi:hypothetical protein|nr:hypothetical protein [Verrucomicrobiae bacterium]